MNCYLLCIEDITSEMIQEVERRMPQRFAYAKRFKFQNDFLRCVGVGVLLLRNFPNLMEEQIQKNEHGKMSIEGECEFNVSHSGKYIVLVKDKNPIGVDIEKVADRHFDVAKKVFTKEEQQWMNDDLKRFFILWTQKESLVKAVGCGITVPLESFSVLPFEKQQFVEYEGNQWYGFTKQIDNHFVSVCSKSKISELNFIK